eukprot:gene4558-7942_t
MIHKQRSLPQYLQRFWKYTQMDMEQAISQMLELFYDPKKVYRAARNRKFIRDSWSRDDPAFVMIQLGFILSMSIAYATAFKMNFWNILLLIFNKIFIEFLLLSIILSTITWFISNKYLKTPSAGNQDVEWLYSFDIHCNVIIVLLLQEDWLN